MLDFKSFIVEAADSKQNLHLTHADEDLFERGDAGAEAAIEYITDFAQTVGKGEVQLTVKWDGAPAIFAGWDPLDGKFFVGTKSVFNASPKIYKTQKDITDNESGGKATKLKVALEELPKVGIPKNTVLQGDMMFTKGDQKYETIDNQRFITVHPNTIVYAWPVESDIGKKIRNANMGIIWHTTYTGRGSLQDYRARFGVDVSKMKQTRTCWMDDAYFKGVDIAFSETEYRDLFSLTMKAKKKIGDFDKIVTVMNSIPSNAVGSGIKTYINSKIRTGNLPDPAIAYNEYMEYVKNYWEDKVIAKLKTDKSKEAKRAALKQLVSDINNVSRELKNAFEYVDLITKAKMILITKLNLINNQRAFVLTSKGFKVTDPEGYVAINSKKGEAVKFVDRLNFSHFNFSQEYIKGWQR